MPYCDRQRPTGVPCILLCFGVAESQGLNTSLRWSDLIARGLLSSSSQRAYAMHDPKAAAFREIQVYLALHSIFSTLNKVALYE
ncbi:hypothetical protein M438DRAFT_346685 [Aureobasidium pullulans EXF-150]|uniref:Uncharacterized protein n=1 Tax=Aureobasidium pullulans EXF-150 TaxID=1043002 RepID=A0A074XLZ7_AURPU|nr:uncharacterized protein M438DRAFT_346685 [Aureobasidium pullulans EXF-150]KEQ83032.1 hypothetical protein M438DRAFT_346685 [Aureobasidium pullulans EXF-150]